MATKPSFLSENSRAFPSRLSLMKHEAMQLGFYRTARMLEIAVQEIGWEVQGLDTPEEQRERQHETFDPNYRQKRG